MPFSLITLLLQSSAYTSPPWLSGKASAFETERVEGEREGGREGEREREGGGGERERERERERELFGSEVRRPPRDREEGRGGGRQRERERVGVEESSLA